MAGHDGRLTWPEARARLLAHPVAIRPRRIRLAYEQARHGAPDWTALGSAGPDWRRARAAAADGPRVLIATGVGLHQPSAIVESMLAVGLTLRGASVEALLCDGEPPACMACQWDWFPGDRLVRIGPQRDLCPTCVPTGRRPYDDLGLPVHGFRGAPPLPDWLATRLRSGLEEHARAGALRFLGRGDLDDARAPAILERYRAAAEATARATWRVLEEISPQVVVVNHGIYVPQGVIAEVARAAGCRVVTWNAGYRERTVVFSHDRTYHHTLLDEPASLWEDLELTPMIEDRLCAYLESRATGRYDQVTFSGAARVFDRDAVAATLDIDRSRPVIGVLTNVVWDAQLHYRPGIYPSMLDWLFETVDVLSRRTDLDVIVRAHPAELRGALVAQQRAIDELAARFPALPPHVRLVGPDSPLSTYAVADLCDTTLIYGTKMGVELAARGRRVVTAGEAWVRGKGVTSDPADRAEYLALLDSLPLDPLTIDEAARARRYAYHYFFRRMMPLAELRARVGHPPFESTVADLLDLGLGASTAFGILCNGILDGDEFVYPAELLEP